MKKQHVWRVVETDIHGIKCDKVFCGWQDMSVKREEYDAYLSKVCPRCGSPLLTEADYRAVRVMEAGVLWINILFGWWGLIFGYTPTHETKGDLRGDGRPRFTTVERKTDA